MSSSYTVFFDDYWFKTSLPSIIVYAVVSAFTIFANLLLCVAFWKDPFGELRTAQNYFILNLAIADLVMGVISEPLLVVTYWHDNNLIYFIHYLFAVLSGTCSLMNITALSIVRYYAVKQPFQTQSIVSERSVMIGIGFMWVTAFHYPILLLLGWRNDMFQLYLYVFASIIPTIIFTGAYFLVYKTLRRHSISLKQLGEGKSLALSNALRTEKAATRTILIVLVGFLSLWIPFLIIDFIIVHCITCRDEQFHLARDVTLSLVYFSSGINPVIYAWRVNTFRRAFLRVLGITKPFSSPETLWNRLPNTNRNYQSKTVSFIRIKREGRLEINSPSLKLEDIDSISGQITQEIDPSE